MEVITSLDNKRIKNYSKLLNKKYRDEEGLFLVEGEHLVIEASKAGCLIEVIKCEDYEMDFDVTTTLVTYDVIKKLSNTLNPQKVVGVCKKLSDKEIGNKVLLLEDIQDPGNLGTIIRSSVAFGVDTVVLSNNTVDLYNDKVLRSSEGMIFHIDIVKRDVYELVDLLHAKGYKVYGTKVDGGTDLKNVTVSDKCVIVMGNEGNGVSSKLLDKCDEYIYINMKGTCESLNVGVATSIILYELL
ncbi:MAG: TrmH family RNA methyltransferase [Candidatus Coprovivens sp.]